MEEGVDVEGDQDLEGGGDVEECENVEGGGNVEVEMLKEMKMWTLCL